MDSRMMERLFFIRYLFVLAEQQTKLSKPMRYSSVLTFHDSVELFLQVVADEVGADVKKDTKFHEYWHKINEKLKERDEILGSQQAMMRLNGSRVELKHRGTPVAEQAIAEYRVEVLDFFRESCQKIFKIDFESISLVATIDFAPVQEKLRAAELHADRGEFDQAITKVAIAFELLIKEYVNRSYSNWWDSPYLFGKDFSHGLSEARNLRIIDAESFGEDVCEAISSIQDALKIISLGLDFRKYAKYKQLAPFIWWPADSEEPAGHKWTENNKTTATQYRFCYDFVVESALCLQEAFNPITNCQI